MVSLPLSRTLLFFRDNSVYKDHSNRLRRQALFSLEVRHMQAYSIIMVSENVVICLIIKLLCLPVGLYFQLIN